MVMGRRSFVNYPNDTIVSQLKVASPLSLHADHIRTPVPVKWEQIILYNNHQKLSVTILYIQTGHLLKPETTKRNHRNETAETTETAETKQNHRNKITETSKSHCHY